MDEDEIRALVRDAIARHLGTSADAGSACAVRRPGSLAPGGSVERWVAPRAPASPSWKTHLSHGRFVFLAPAEPDAPCVVEPQVTCHHCGFCQSYGH